jgi:O-antigen ligase
MTREYVEQALSAADGGALEGIPIGSGVLHRLETSRIFSFFLHPNSYAMYLGILGAITAGWIWSMRESLHRFAAESAGRIFRKSSASGNPDKRASSLLSILTGAGGVILLALLLASCILIPLCLWLTYSRGGLLSALAAAGAFLVSALWRKKAPKEALAAVILVVLVITLFQGQTAFSADNIEVRDVSFIGRLKDPQTVAQRLSYWKTALAMIADNPWFGVGWGAFESAYPRYMVLGGYPVRLAHNNYLQVWAETGLLGLNLFVGILLVALYTFWRKSRSFSAGAMRGMACGLGAGIVGFMVNSLVDFALYLPSLCFFVFTCLGLLAAIPGDDENDKFSIPLKVPSAIVLQVALVAFIILLFRSCIALRLYETVEKQASSAFPNAFSRERGFRSDPQFQYRVLKESVPQLKKSISYFSFSSDSHMMLGNTYLRLAALEQAPHLIREAIGHLNRAAELNSLSPYIQQLLAQAYWKEGAAANQTGSFQKALRAEQKASNNFPVHPAFHKELADIYTALGNVEQAQQEAARAAELSKHYREF